VPEPPPIDPLGILEVLVRHHVRFVLIGGVAANIHGYPLPTEDVDITPETSTANYRRLAAALLDMNARIRVAGEPDGVAFTIDEAALAGNVAWTLTTDRGDIDVVTKPDGTAGFGDLRRDAIDVELGASLTVAVASLPDIIRSKEAAGRPKDQAALPALRATLERLDDPQRG
jgi:hypothetical protein